MASLLERAKKANAPFIEGNEAVFVWKGARKPLLMGDFNAWAFDKALDMAEDAQGVWTARLELPADTYMEYSFFAKPDEKYRLGDPLNKRSKPNGIGQRNAWFAMPGWNIAPETKRRKGVLTGTVAEERFTSANGLAAGKERKVMFYQPPTGTAVPLLLVWDGPDYVQRGFVVRIVDNLIAQKRMRPIAMLMIDHGGRFGARGIEYHTSEATVALAEGELLLLAKQRLNLLDEKRTPGVHGVLGASMGGIMALTTGWMLPHVFGHVISQAGMFASWTSRPRPMIFDLIEQSPTAPIRIWQDCGTFDFLLPGNHAMRDLLQAKGYDLHYSEFHAGHNYTAWANSLVGALESQFPVN